MGEFLTIGQATDLFEQTGCLGMQNCIFVALKDTSREGFSYGVQGSLGGLVGSAIDGMLSAKEALKNMYYDGFIINSTEEGLVFIPLYIQGVSFTINVSKMIANERIHFIIHNSEITGIKIKNYNVFKSKTKALVISLTDGQKIHLLVNVKEKLLPYHERNFAEFQRKVNA